MKNKQKSIFIESFFNKSEDARTAEEVSYLLWDSFNNPSLDKSEEQASFFTQWQLKSWNAIYWSAEGMYYDAHDRACMMAIEAGHM